MCVPVARFQCQLASWLSANVTLEWRKPLGRLVDVCSMEAPGDALELPVVPVSVWCTKEPRAGAFFTGLTLGWDSAYSLITFGPILMR